MFIKINSLLSDSEREEIIEALKKQKMLSQLKRKETDNIIAFQPKSYSK